MSKYLKNVNEQFSLELHVLCLYWTPPQTLCGDLTADAAKIHSTDTM